MAAYAGAVLCCCAGAAAAWVQVPPFLWFLNPAALGKVAVLVGSEVREGRAQPHHSNLVTQQRTRNACTAQHIITPDSSSEGSHAACCKQPGRQIGSRSRSLASHGSCVAPKPCRSTQWFLLCVPALGGGGGEAGIHIWILPQLGATLPLDLRIMQSRQPPKTHAKWASPKYAWHPVNSSHRVMPKLYTSAALLMWPRSSASGAM